MIKVVKTILVILKSQSHLKATMIMKMLIWKVKNLYYPEGIQDRFNYLYVGFVRKKKHENRNEFEFLLDELLYQGAINPTKYTQLNTRLTEDLMTEKEEEDE